ncbi:MAG: TIGR02757 family protein [Crocinitomicaceae bacterium]|nr:TIGR02757 family protein [Crocinitomicaceae bacterium]MCF8410480.1 TIGR02757 family protein [Crocinitomicaceae bacterium]MCF8443921.1 TIGR02757 family protein [Crocinitomicaceae bacterium]
MDFIQLKEFLDFKSEQYENKKFLTDDPIQLVHQFSKKEDQEIIGFLISTIAWGNRKSIICNGEKLIEIMHDSPHEFVLNYPSSNQTLHFVHRTFNATDLDFFLRALNHIYSTKSGLENCFQKHEEIPGIKGRIVSFREQFLVTTHERRSEKHISNPLQNSACKRLNMFLRWMVRPSNKGVDLGIWKSIAPAELYLPLDVHTSRNARRLGLLKRSQDDWKALNELMDLLKQFDPMDPVKYDFALFGIGVNEKDLFAFD